MQLHKMDEAVDPIRFCKFHFIIVIYMYIARK